jgi:hypothetical protein
MSKLNLLVDLKGYEGSNANTCQAEFQKNAQYIGIDIENSEIKSIAIAPSTTESIFSVATADAKKLIYIEADKECDIIVNGVTESTIKPIVINDSSKKGVFLKSSSIESLSIINNSATDSVNVYYIAIK